MIERLPDLAPLQHKPFRSVWLASHVSNCGSLIQIVGASWLMTLISASADMVALVQACSTLPIMLFSLVSGAVADNFNRRAVMLLAQFFMFAVSVLLLAASHWGVITPWMLLAFTFLIGCGMSLHGPSWQAAVGDMVPKADLPAAVALNGMGFNLARSVGPAIGGAVVASLGVGAAFALNAASYMGLIYALLRWNPPVSDRKLPREGIAAAVAAGLRYVAMSPNIGKVLLRGFVFGFTTVPVVALLPLVTRDIVGGEAFLYGVMLGCFGAGAVAGALSSGAIRRRFSSETTVRLTFAGYVVCAIIVSLSPWATLSCAALMIGGACNIVTMSLLNISVQLATPRWVVGRALSFHQMALFGGMAVGSWAWGLVAEIYDPATALQIATVTMLGGAVMGVGRLALPALPTLNLDPSTRWREPRLEFEVSPRSGPICVMIEYIVRDPDVPEFLDLMAERRRIRKRDGARRWSLTRDMEHGQRWIERYHLPTWLEYLRFNQRMTHADMSVGDRIRQLHAGTEPPRAHRLIERQPGRRGPEPGSAADVHH